MPDRLVSLASALAAFRKVAVMIYDGVVYVRLDLARMTLRALPSREVKTKRCACTWVQHADDCPARPAKQKPCGCGLVDDVGVTCRKHTPPEYRTRQTTRRK